MLPEEEAQPPGLSAWSGAGLLLVVSRPPAGREEEFHQWYEEEHIPPRTRLAGWLTARRYVAEDDPAVFLALYDLADLAVLRDPQYVALRSSRSAREEEIMQASELVDRRVYRLLASVGDGWGSPGTGRSGGGLPVRLADPSLCGELLLCVWWEPAAGFEAEFHAWYEEEHLPMLATVPGWLRCRRLELVDGGGAAFLAIHDLADGSVFNHPNYRAAISTPRRDLVVAHRSGYERHVYRLLRNFDPV